MDIETFLTHYEYSDQFAEYFAKLFKTEVIDNMATYTQPAQPYEIRKIGYWGFDIQPEDIFRMERSKKWFNEFVKPLQEKGFRVRQIP